MRKFLLMIPVILMLSSCMGLTNISTPDSVALNQGNFKFIKSVSAETRATYVFGMGGFRKSAMSDVIEDLRTEADLQPNQALADIRIKTTNRVYLGIVVVRTLTASASVVEFKDSETNTFAKGEECVYKESEPEPMNKVNNNKELKEIKQDSPYTKETAYNKLLEIKESIINGTEKDRKETIEEYKKIKKWYYRIQPVYSEVENLLKEVKRLL